MSSIAGVSTLPPGRGHRFSLDWLLAPSLVFTIAVGLTGRRAATYERRRAEVII